MATLLPASVTTVSAGGILGFLGATTAVFVWPLPRLGSLLWSAWQPHSVVRKFFSMRAGAVQRYNARMPDWIEGSVTNSNNLNSLVNLLQGEMRLVASAAVSHLDQAE